MFDNDNILRSPIEVARDANANEPIRIVLEDPDKVRLAKLYTATTVCTVLVIVAGLVLWLWGYPTQKNNPGFWHVSLVSGLFWISVTQGMVAISAILRITHASWRYPLNRLLDMGSLFGFWVAALLPLLIHAHAVIYTLGSTQYQSNVWRVATQSTSVGFDAIAIGIAYIAGWLLLFLTSLPDFAILRDRAPEGSKSKALYRKAALWWNGSEHQWRVLRRAEGVLIVGVLLSFVGSQTVLGWDFQLASARNWDSSIFAPLFTLGSLLGGLALTTLVMTQVNRTLRGRGFIQEVHYDSIGKFMIALGMVWFYFRYCDYLTAWYGHTPEEWALQNNRVSAFPILVALMVFGCFVAPVFGNMIARIRKSVWGLCTISVFVLIGLATQRYLDTVPTFAPNYPLSALLPTPASLTVFAGLAAMFFLTYLLAARYFPIISWWGIGKDRTRTAERKLGNTMVTVMVEDPPVWET